MLFLYTIKVNIHKKFKHILFDTNILILFINRFVCFTCGQNFTKISKRTEHRRSFHPGIETIIFKKIICIQFMNSKNL